MEDVISEEGDYIKRQDLKEYVDVMIQYDLQQDRNTRRKGIQSCISVFGEPYQKGP